MKRLYVYNGAFAVIGLSIGFQATLSVFSGEYSLPILLMLSGGSGMVLIAIYESLQTDPDEFRISAAALFGVIGAACLTLLGTILSAV